jgi:hypothetical protein
MLNFAERARVAREKRIPRGHIAQTLRERGIRSDLANEITDLGLQAAYKAMDALIETPNLSSDPLVKLNALNVARGVIAVELAYLGGVVTAVNSALGVTGGEVVVEGSV